MSVALALAACVVTAAWLAGDRGDRSDGTVPAAPRAVLDKVPVRILDGVYYLGDFEVAALYLVDAGAELVLVDSGFPHLRSSVEAAVRGLGLDPQRIRHVLLTHRHADHSMAAGDWGPGVQVYAGADDAELLEHGGPMEAFYGDRIPPPGFRMPPVRVDHRLEGGEVLRFGGTVIRALATPGHTAGSMCYLLERQGRTVIFSGDVVMSLAAETGTYTALMDKRYGGDAEAFLASLRRLRELDVDVLLPGHPYMDHDATGLPADPFLGSEAWRRRVDQGIAELEQAVARFGADGRDFLNGQPRRLQDRLLYLGEPGTSAVYALETDAGLALVGAPAAGRVLDLRDALSGLGRSLDQVVAVLLPRGDAAGSEGLGELVWHVRSGGDRPSPVLYGSEEVLAGREDGRVVGEGLRLSLPPLEVLVRALPGYHPADLGYELMLDGRRALFTGRTILKRNKYLQQKLALDGPGADPLGLARTLESLRGLDLRLWLPSEPFQAQNANLYEGDWDRELDGNLELLRGHR